jgi:ABC-type Mn2+/Zn2+ transport system ATPase subunit
MIRIRNLNIDYMGAPVLQDINLQIPAGQCSLIAGPLGWCESEEEYV